MSDNAKVTTAAAVKKVPRLASPEVLAEARAITKNLTWDDLVRISQKPRYTGWILWKVGGAIEQISPMSTKDGKERILARAWKTSERHVIVHRPADTEYKCVELDPETKRPIQAGTAE